MRALRTMQSISLVAVTGLVLAGCAGLAGAATESADPVDSVSESPSPDPAETEPEPVPVPDPAETEAEPEPVPLPDAAELEPEPVPTPTATASDGRAVVDVVAVGTMGNDAVVSAGGYAQGVIELGGTCNFTLIQGGVKVEGRTAAEPDAKTTWCANVELRLPAPGQPWTLQLDYASPTSAGTGTVTSSGDLS